jgi:hypothetical protein
MLTFLFVALVAMFATAGTFLSIEAKLRRDANGESGEAAGPVSPENS